jgi:hypothetical protein
MLHTWPQIRTTYEARISDLPSPSLREILNLIRHIETTRLAVGLHGDYSMFDLLVSQTPDPRNGPHLRISPIDKNRLEFRYLDTAIESRQWHRTVPASEAIPRFENFLKQLHWFSDL